jgi:hypothetical protein
MVLKPSGRFKLRKPRVLTLFAALAVVVAIGALPASAAPYTVYTVDGAGSARFAKYGDHIYLSDHDKDGYEVVEWRWNWWGPDEHGGCKDVNLRGLEYTNIHYSVCLGDSAHPGGKKPVVDYSSYSDLAFVYNNG